MRVILRYFALKVGAVRN